MNTTTVGEASIRSTPPTLALEEAGWGLKVAAFYQDELTRQWALQPSNLITDLVGHACLRMEAWNIESLSYAPVRSKAVQAAVAADVIIVAIHAAAELPAALALWAGEWLPRRREMDGLMLALVGTATYDEMASLRTHDALLEIARRGGLAYLPQDRMVRPQRG